MHEAQYRKPPRPTLDTETGCAKRALRMVSPDDANFTTGPKSAGGEIVNAFQLPPNDSKMVTLQRRRKSQVEARGSVRKRAANIQLIRHWGNCEPPLLQFRRDFIFGRAS